MRGWVHIRRRAKDERPGRGRVLTSLVLLAALIATTPLVGCSGGPETVIAGQVTITVWHSQKAEAAKLLAQLAAEFSTRETNIIVKLVAKPDEATLLEDLRQAASSERAPCVAEVPADQLAVLRLAGIIRPLQSFIANRYYGLPVSDSEDFWPCLVQANAMGRQVWGVPFSHKLYALLYNPELVSRPPATWDELKSMAQSLTYRNGEPALSRFGVAFRPDAELLCLLLYQNGGRLLSGDSSRWVFNGAEGRGALEYLYELATVRKAALLTMGRPEQAVATGRAAMAIGQPTWPLDPKDGPVAVAPLPKGAIAAALAPGTSLTLVNGHTEAEEEAAWRFMRWLTSPEISARWSASTGDVPIRRQAMAQFVWAAGLGSLPGWPEVVAQMDSVVLLPSVTGTAAAGTWEKVRGDLSQAVTAYLLGAVSSSQSALDSVAIPANRALSGP